MKKTGLWILVLLILSCVTVLAEGDVEDTNALLRQHFDVKFSQYNKEVMAKINARFDTYETGQETVIAEFDKQVKSLFYRYTLFMSLTLLGVVLSSMSIMFLVWIKRTKMIMLRIREDYNELHAMLTPSRKKSIKKVPENIIFPKTRKELRQERAEKKKQDILQKKWDALEKQREAIEKAQASLK